MQENVAKYNPRKYEHTHTHKYNKIHTKIPQNSHNTIRGKNEAYSNCLVMPKESLGHVSKQCPKIFSPRDGWFFCKGKYMGEIISGKNFYYLSNFEIYLFLKFVQTRKFVLHLIIFMPDLRIK